MRNRCVIALGSFAVIVILAAPAFCLERVRLGISAKSVVFLPFYYGRDKKFFDRAQSRGELGNKPLAPGDIFDYSIARGLK